MRIFLSYPSELKATAEPIAFSLRSRGHKDLPPGRSYDDQIEHAIKQSDILIFLIAPASVERGRYTLTEMEFARSAWSHPADRVLPVLVEPTDLTKVPPFLKGVTILEPQGNGGSLVGGRTAAGDITSFNEGMAHRANFVRCISGRRVHDAPALQ